jgi:hypothetical protein
MIKPVNAEIIELDLPFNWREVLDSLTDKEGVDITPDPAIWRMEVPAYTEIHNIWTKANYKTDSIKWTNFYPGQHYDSKNIDEVLCEKLGVGYRRSVELTRDIQRLGIGTLKMIQKRLTGRYALLYS